MLGVWIFACNLSTQTRAAVLANPPRRVPSAFYVQGELGECNAIQLLDTPFGSSFLSVFQSSDFALVAVTR